LEIRFLGGASEVGRSGILLKGSKKILMDYGLKVNERLEYPLPAGQIDAFILSHAHLDHCGNAPALYHDGLPIAFGTSPTLDISSLLIEDSIKINRQNKTKGHYSKKEAQLFSRSYMSYPYHTRIDYSDYNITFYDAGHIAGSAVTKLENNKTGKNIVYTGDFKREQQTLHEGAEIVKADTLIIESTYGARDHPDRESLIKLFISNIKEIIENNGTALLPAFAVGRSQELLAILHKYKLSGQTYMDGMSRKATEIALRHKEFIKNGSLLAEAVSNTVQIAKPQDRADALHGGNIIITTAGMLNGGPVLDYITKLNSRSMVFLTGYQAEGTNGRKLLDERPLDIDGRKFAVRTPFAFYDFSAHAGQADLYEYVKGADPERVICVHGDEDASQAFKEWLELEGYEAYAPKVGESIKIDF
jgi:putative mRNA 3-end processing factor